MRKERNLSLLPFFPFFAPKSRPRETARQLDPLPPPSGWSWLSHSSILSFTQRRDHFQKQTHGHEKAEANPLTGKLLSVANIGFCVGGGGVVVAVGSGRSHTKKQIHNLDHGRRWHCCVFFSLLLTNAKKKKRLALTKKRAESKSAGPCTSKSLLRSHMWVTRDL